MNTFKYENYKILVRDWIRSQDKNGHGQLRKMALHLGVGSTYMSQVFKADRNLTGDQALDLTKYMGFTKLETDFFVLLVLKERAGSHELKKYFEGKIEVLRKSSQNLKERIDTDKELTEEEKAQFYSDWYYSAIRNLLAIPGSHSVSEIAARFDLSKTKVANALDFLVKSNLCQLNDGNFSVSTKVTHLEATSVHIKNRQLQWRMKSIESMNKENESSLYYTCPMSLSEKTILKVREKLIRSIQNILSEVRESPSEELACLNIDWFK